MDAVAITLDEAKAILRQGLLRQVGSIKETAAVNRRRRLEGDRWEETRVCLVPPGVDVEDIYWDADDRNTRGVRGMGFFFKRIRDLNRDEALLALRLVEQEEEFEDGIRISALMSATPDLLLLLGLVVILGITVVHSILA